MAWMLRINSVKNINLFHKSRHSGSKARIINNGKERQLLRALTFTVLLCILGCPAWAGASDWTKQRDIEKILDKKMRQDGIPGLSIAIVKNGQPWWSAGFGHAPVGIDRSLHAHLLVGTGADLHLCLLFPPLSCRWDGHVAALGLTITSSGRAQHRHRLAHDPLIHAGGAA